MQRFVPRISPRLMVSGFGVAILVTLLWYFLPYVHAFTGRLPRFVVIGFVVLLWGGYTLWHRHRAKKRDAVLSAGLTAAAPGQAASSGEVAALAEKLKTALAILRKARGTRGYLYEQPWYVIIGPPAVGKTTALLNAGLKFPLAEQMGQGATAGVGGTRLCDWWFTEEAVLIDTAGRYTTQESSAEIDKAGWEGFLDLLRRTRQRQALNGLIVAISLTDIATAPRETRLAHARAIRRRITEVTTRLALKLPVYVLLTKADLLTGFTEFFSDLNEEQRGQVWGITFPPEPGVAGAAVGFAAEFALLVNRLEDRMIDRLAQERGPDQRALIAGFPAQVASLAAPLGDFLQEAFQGSSLDPAPFLRGVYLASGTQEGTPFDRLTGALAGLFGIDQRRALALRPVAGRSYFLKRLLRDVIFQEAMLAGASLKQRRQRLLLRISGFAGIGLVFALLLGGLVLSRANNATAITASADGLAAYSNTAQPLPLNPLASPDLLAILPLLDQARSLPFGPGGNYQPGFTGLGLSQAHKLTAGAGLTYEDALSYALLPRLMLQLEAEMRGGMQRPEFLYEATRVYLMLGSQAPSVDPDLVEAWMSLDWQRLYPGPALQPQRDDMMLHLRALLAAPLPSPPVPLDWPLVDSARVAFSNVSDADRVYSRIRDSAAAAAVPAWTPAGAMGPAGLTLFARASGRPLTAGIPGFYSTTGFRQVLLPALGNAAQDIASESWVRGTDEQITPGSPAMQALEAGVIKDYEADYQAKWDAMLADLTLAKAPDLNTAVQNLYFLSSPQSPMLQLLTSITTQLQLSKSASAAAAPAAPPPVDYNKDLSSLQGLMAPATAGATTAAVPLPDGSDVDLHFAPLISFAAGSNAPITLTMQLMGQLYQQLLPLASTASGNGGAAAPAAGGQAAILLGQQAAAAPVPLNNWLGIIAGNAGAGETAVTQKAAQGAFNGPGGPAELCSKAVAGSYPFEPGATQDIQLQDFTSLFMPNGSLDSFFNQQVRPFVDMSGAGWRVQPVNGVNPPISQAALEDFQRAEAIRTIFFAQGGAPTVTFTITPASLDAGATQVMLSLGSLNLSYAHGPPVPTLVTWPGADGMQVARLIISPVGGGAPTEIDATGPWAVFRLFAQGELTQTGASDQYTLSFYEGGHTVSFTISAGSVLNPFAPGVLTGFHCPSLS
jgi:type VI secretion system protein ImpL